MTQAEALDILKTGANVFLTGEPGSGKTHTVNEYVRYLRSCGVEPAITASTGIAATHIGGWTIHSWSGIGVRRDLSERDLDAISQNKNVYRRVAGAHILIIDEVSMLSARTLTMVDAVCREVRRRRAEPFGGLQVVLVGDFFQLPPVEKRAEDETGTQISFDSQPQAQERFAFLAPAWKALNPIVCYLSEQHRQEDKTFLEFLSALRRATVAETHMKLLRTRYSPTPRGVITQLFSHNADVDAVNERELEKLPGKSETFEMEGRGPDTLVASLARGCLSPEVLKLKIGARVMFTRNDFARHRYVNGTIGEVVGFAEGSNYPLVKIKSDRTVLAEPEEWRIEDGGRVLARIRQVPLRLAWAMTVHKSQGMSLDAAHMDLSQTFEYGQGYVALSRVRTLSGLSLAGLNKRALEVHPDMLAKDEEFRASSEAAREKFGALPLSELSEMHRNLIKACGGKPGMGRKTKTKEKKVPTRDITKELLLKKLSLADIAKERKLTVGTILNHLEELAAQKKILPERDLTHFKLDPKRFAKMQSALQTVFKKHGAMPLSPARALLGDDYTFDELRLTRLFLKSFPE